ncbi:metallophosphoesterase family protein [Candidatus Contubernalis alkaliaceticus]|uniref:metallophosphoesterase family protein n=1 Tax=Candidatus Contubernalis alkaliaceticus TaxID=338645 RepID=UPI001F4C1829|nr:exonuclease SbcCD subunit D [Candidatus Contubernalis alkalaceticus]UNC91058.1 exonuclease SbcCD subunit D [Candidatus Contubernalis alkalaceticus]
MPVSIIHCGDIHLGFNQYNNEERFHDFHRSFAYIVNYAIENKVDYFIVTGDFFNRRSINPRTLSQAISELSKLKEKNIQVIVVEGNHDKAPYGEGAESWLHFLNEQGYLYLLSPRFEEGSLVLESYKEKQGGNLVSFPGVRFVGLGYQGSMTSRRVNELNEQLEKSEDPTILMLHSAVDMLMHLGGIKNEDIAILKDKIDYVAMGHIHHRYELEDWIYNPGCPECWDVGEGAKEKGFYHVVLEEGEIKVSHIPGVRRPVHSCAVNVTGCEEVKDVYNLCDKEIDKLDVMKGSNPIVQLVIKGSTPFSPLSIDTKLLEDRIKNAHDCLIVEVVNNTVMKGEQEALTDNPAEMNREDLEREVLRQIFLNNGGLNLWADEMVDISKQIKELIHNEAADQSISVLVENLAEKIVAEEVKEQTITQEKVQQESEVAAALESNYNEEVKWDENI